MTRERTRSSAGPPMGPSAPTARARGGKITALLGPTNTGKTHFAVERMLAHRSGMMGLPLRLLAREVYDKIVRIRGVSEVALITGEERIVPPHPRYFVCTVEAMPVDIPVAFLAVDEIQLCADLERGHVFTDRLLHARGEEETMLLGAASMRGAIARLAPQTVFVSRPRFSDLAYTGPRKLTRLPRRSAIVAFSVEDVYGIADLIRAQRGGAAVVLGALSPRTRNAQVALYQSGDVDFLVATDAIGMGINMDVDHISFAARDKFDGLVNRPLGPEEIGQIAGRAGRYMNDGTFGVTADLEPLDAEIVAQVENHRYDPVRVLQWRNDALDFTSLSGLLACLDAPPPKRGLVKVRTASDHWTLRALAADPTVRDFAVAPAAIRRLWAACQLPDFRKLTPDEHAKLVAQIYCHLMSESGTLPDEWLRRQIARLDIVGGDVDTLAGRLAQIRTWTYAANRPDWTADPPYWQGETRAVEDRLSDALHERLTQRFIDRRTAALMRHLRDDEDLPLRLDESGALSLGEEHVGKLEGFRFAADHRAEGIHGRTLRAAALKGLDAEIRARARALAEAPDDAISLSEHGKLWWSGAPVGRLAAGAHPLAPAVELLADDLLAGTAREAVQERLVRWTSGHIARVLAPLAALRRAADARDSALPRGARGLAFQLAEALGTLDRRKATLPADLSAAERTLRGYGVRFGRHTFYLPRLVKPKAAALTALLWAVHARLARIPPPLVPGVTSVAIDADLPRGFLEAAGFRLLGQRAVRADVAERAAAILAQAARRRSDSDRVLRGLSALLGTSSKETEAVAKALGFRRTPTIIGARGEGVSWLQARWCRTNPRPQGPAHRRWKQRENCPESPFARLAALIPIE